MAARCVRRKTSTASSKASPANRCCCAWARTRTAPGAREVTVVPVADESRLRNLAWIEENRRKVDQMTGGKVAYIYMPDTANGGLTAFNRYFYAQIGKQGAIVDERFNGGGLLATDIAEILNRKPLSAAANRVGSDLVQPQGIFGPKVMIINERAGSGGDAMPWYFKRAGVGKLIGTRTWGGLVGMAGGPPLMDGGFVGAPSSGIYNPADGRVGSGEHRRAARYRGGAGPGAGSEGPRPATGEGGRSGDGGTQEESAAGAAARRFRTTTGRRGSDGRIVIGEYCFPRLWKDADPETHTGRRGIHEAVSDRAYREETAVRAAGTARPPSPRLPPKDSRLASTAPRTRGWNRTCGPCVIVKTRRSASRTRRSYVLTAITWSTYHCITRSAIPGFAPSAPR